MATTYKITGTTNSWIAQRDIVFKGKTEITLAENLSLKSAQEKLLSFFNEDYQTSFQNWGLARINHPHNTCSFNDGTRTYNYDSRYYRIELEESKS